MCAIIIINGVRYVPENETPKVTHVYGVDLATISALLSFYKTVTGAAATDVDSVLKNQMRFEAQANLESVRNARVAQALSGWQGIRLSEEGLRQLVKRVFDAE
jgi:hypothetical protein